MFENYKKDINELNAQIEEMNAPKQEAPKKEYKEPITGEYLTTIRKIALEPTRDGRPKFTCWLKIVDGDFEGSVLFYNKVMAGTKNDTFMIKLVQDFIDKLAPTEPCAFNGDFDDFAETLAKVEQELVGTVQVLVDYDKENWGNIEIKDCWDCA